MRTKTFNIEASGKEYPVPAEWDKIISVTVSGQDVDYEVIKDLKGKKRTLRIKSIVEDKQLISAHVILKD